MGKTSSKCHLEALFYFCGGCNIGYCTSPSHSLRFCRCLWEELVHWKLNLWVGSWEQPRICLGIQMACSLQDICFLSFDSLLQASKLETPKLHRWALFGISEYLVVPFTEFWSQCPRWFFAILTGPTRDESQARHPCIWDILGYLIAILRVTSVKKMDNAPTWFG